VTFNAKQQRAIKRWISRAAPIKGLFFRSVEYRYMDPIDVLSGAGARAYGGRFAPIGTRAVYLSVRPFRVPAPNDPLTAARDRISMGALTPRARSR
jgi:hypothetical protein